MTVAPTIRLRTLRLNMGLSTRKAAIRIGIARETLERAERGEDVWPETAKKIADFYGLRVTDIWPVDPAPASEAVA